MRAATLQAMGSPRRVDLTVHGLAHGGDAVGRLPDGKACFVAAAIPGERVTAEVTEERARFARAVTVEVLEPVAERVTPPCPLALPGRCGGCRLQHIDVAHQAVLLRRVVVDTLERIGRIPAPPVADTVRPHNGWGYRNQARFAPHPDGRLGFRRAGSHDIEPVAECPLLDAGAAAARDAAGDDWRGVEAVVVRGDADARALLEVLPGAGALPALPPGDVPVAVVGTDGAVALRGEPLLEERAAGRTWRVSPTSFFQPSRAGATTLAGLVRAAAEVTPGTRALDLYAGVGLFAAVLAEDGAQVVAVEAHPAAAADARANLRDLDVEVRCGAAEDALDAHGPRPDVIVLDPPRRGAGPALTARIAEGAARRIVMVSCDPAALARDARVLLDSGWQLDRVVPVDQFTHTAHVEAVATFTRAA